jgi:hypothetical protein
MARNVTGALAVLCLLVAVVVPCLVGMARNGSADICLIRGSVVGTLPPCQCNKVLGSDLYCAKDMKACPSTDDAQLCTKAKAEDPCDTESAPKLGTGGNNLLLWDDPCDGTFQKYYCVFDAEATPKCHSGSPYPGSTPCPGFKKIQVDCAS